MSSRFDFAIIGNGAIGTHVAFEILENFNDAKIAIIGPQSRTQSASSAAGAMANVYAELEDKPSNFADDEEGFLRLGVEGSELWGQFLRRHEMVDCITATNTVMYLQEDASVFEAKNFALASARAVKDGVGEVVGSEKLQNLFPAGLDPKRDATVLKGEFAIDTSKFFLAVDSILSSHPNITNFDGFVSNVLPESLHLTLQDGRELSCDRLVVANGAYASDLFDEGEVITTLSGFGTAIAINYDGDLPEVFHHQVVRTANRGGSQCGLHVVPRHGKSLYLGAGNTVGFNATQEMRLETVRYLIDKFQREFVGVDWGYDVQGRVLMGARPKTIDGLPAIGPVRNGRIYVATGTNRAGLTWAPRIAAEIATWFSDGTSSGLFDRWDPGRKPRPFGTEDEGIDYFVESRLAAALEHDLVGADTEVENRRQHLSLVAKSLLEKVRTHNPIVDVGVIHPDHWNVLSHPLQRSPRKFPEL